MILFDYLTVDLKQIIRVKICLSIEGVNLHNWVEQAILRHYSPLRTWRLLEVYSVETVHGFAVYRCGDLGVGVAFHELFSILDKGQHGLAVENQKLFPGSLILFNHKLGSCDKSLFGNGQ